MPKKTEKLYMIEVEILLIRSKETKAYIKNVAQKKDISNLKVLQAQIFQQPFSLLHISELHLTFREQCRHKLRKGMLLEKVQ